MFGWGCCYNGCWWGVDKVWDSYCLRFWFDGIEYCVGVYGVGFFLGVVGLK